MDNPVIKSRAKLLQKYVSDEHKELQALYGLQALVVKLDQPASKCVGSGQMSSDEGACLGKENVVCEIN